MIQFSLSINRCPVHPEFQAIMLDCRHQNGSGTGTRLTRSKCCGQWETVKSWPLTKEDLLLAAEEFTEAAGELE